MKSLWNDTEAKKFGDDPLQLRVYTSRLLGQEPNLVLHGGGNTSVKTFVTNAFGDQEEILFIKGSGIDLKTIEKDQFAPVRLDVLKRMAELNQLTDTDMLRLQRAAMVDYRAPNPSLEAILHALIPFQYIDHTHADDVVLITNNKRGKERIRGIYQDRVLIVPYRRAGFELAKTVFKLTRKVDWRNLEGIILLNHGVITFGRDARTSYERMLQLVTLAENYLNKQRAIKSLKKTRPQEDLLTLSQIRRQVSQACDVPMIAALDQSAEACGFANLPNVAAFAGRGPLTADHIIRTKPKPVILGTNVKKDIDKFVASYTNYFNRYTDSRLTMLDPAPRWALWPRHGSIAFGKNVKEARMVSDIANHTMRAIQYGEALGGWKPLSKKHIFAMEYWELQQAKLKLTQKPSELQGKVALVTGAASGIGLACTEALKERGAVVVGLDVNPECTLILDGHDSVGVNCDISDLKRVKETVEMTIRRFGGLDILVSNAGIFTANQRIEDLDEEAWYRSIELNLSSHQRLLKTCIPYMKHGIEPAMVFVASKNVPAPGPGAAAYSVAKAGLTQLARVAAMELGADGIRVNIIHPDAVYDTALWTPEVLEQRAKHYGLSIQEYKSKNILKTEVGSKDVAELVCALVGPAFAKTTGAQIPIDGGNERVI
jgi:rhamnose utilization protein RhaD (predicted bifunctional aldolase and dehydrogenase)/NAD(P)-dependent dehydrogenase (short-subunit alcohol dehydrogenase family)